MRVVVDTNILFSFFWEKSFTKNVIESKTFELITPEITVKEIKKYKREIIRKARIKEKKFNQRLSELEKYVKIMSKKEYSEFTSESERISPDKNDSEFFALCIKEKTFLWSNDSLLKQQDKINVLTTKDIIEMLF